jgi:hypothetical protein
MYINILNHTQHIAVKLYFTWQVVLALNVGRHQAITQEQENIEKHRFLSCHQLKRAGISCSGNIQT